MLQGLQSSCKPAAYLRRAAFTLLVAGLVPTALVGCFGRFPLTRKVYDINQNVSDSKWIRTLVMWVFGIIPVYGLAMFADLIVLNLIEFWSGDPVEISKTIEQEDGSTVAMQTSADGQTLMMTVSREGQVMAERHFVRMGDGTTQVRDASGRQIGLVSPDGQGGFLLSNTLTGETQQLTSTSIGELRAQVL